MTSEKPILQVKNLNTSLTINGEELTVNEDVSFELRKGETLGIVGESGSGKSMTAMSIMRVLPKPIGRIASGEIWLDGENLAAMTDEEMTAVRGRKIGMILQDPHTSLNPVYTIGNQLTEALRIGGQTGDKATLMNKAIQALKDVNVADAERRVNVYPHQMSGGMKQRAVGAIALAGDPKVLIADEPTTALDVTIQLQYLELLQEIQRKTDLSIIFITHDLGIVSRMCNNIVVMYAGRIVERGTVQDVFKAPSHPYTIALLNSVPTTDRKVERLYAIEGQPPPLNRDRVGCSFAPRCPHADAKCRAELPPERPGLSTANNHAAACWKTEQLQ